MINKRLIAGLLISLLPWLAQADVTSVTATIDKNPVMLDEAIVLTVVAEGDAERDAFDSSVLLGDFVVGRTSVGSQTSIVNFSTRQTTTWSTTLFPRSVGDFTIPAFTIEGKSSAPITVKVIPVQQGSDAPARDYYVATEVSQSDVYLQQQLRYTVKLYLASQIERGSLQAPELENAQIQQLGEDKQYTELVNGKRYQVIERNFAILPQQSGEFTIRGPVFSGEVIAANTNQRFGFFNRTKTINRVGPDVDISVKPIPANIDYHWLPSEFVQLDENWQTEEFVVGEPVTRTLTLTAVGVVEEQLPEIEQIYPPAFKLYPDQPGSATAERDNRLIVQRTESVALIPTQPGEFIIPEVKIPWFNTASGITEYATLPTRTITVAPAANMGNESPGTTPETQVTPPVSPQNTAEQNTPALPDNQPTALNAQPSSVAEQGIDLWHWILAGLWLLTAAGWFVYAQRKRTVDPRPSLQNSVTNNDVKSLVSTIEKGNVGEIQAAIRTWLSQFSAAQRWQIQQSIKPELDQMMASAFASPPKAWDKTALISAIQRITTTKTKDGGLTPLYPVNH